MHNTSLLYWERARLIFGAELPSKEKLILLAISDHLGSNADCWPSVSRLSKRTGYGRRSVLYALDALAQLGAITITKKPGGVNHYTLNIAWLQDQCNQCTSAESAPVQQVHQCRHCTGGCSHCTGVVQQVHGGGAESAPKGEQEGEQGRRTRKDTNRNNRALSLDDVKDIDIPKELADALPGYRDAFNAWLPVRPGTSWRQQTMQVVRFHNKMLKAHKDGKDVLDGLGKALDNGWKGLDASYMVDMPKQRATKEAPALIDYKAQYLAQLTGGLK